MAKGHKTVWSQKKEVQEDVSEELAKDVSETEEIVEEVEEKVGVAEEELKEVEEEVISQTEKEVEKAKKATKHLEAVSLVDKAKIIAKEAEGQMEACKLLLLDDLKEYEEAKRALKDGGLNECERLLLASGYIDESEEAIEEESVVFEPKEDMKPIVLQDVSSGKFTGFIMAFIGGAATLGGMAYLATEKSGFTLDLSKIPAVETIKPVFAYYGALIGMKEDTLFGGAFVLLVTLLVMWIIYTVRVSMKGSQNLRFATRQLEEAEAYTTHKGNCKEEMDKVDAHIHDAITTLKTYQVLLNEQKGKLQRILYIEGAKGALSEYHEKSILEMRDTQKLVNTIRSFMATPMSEEGKLSGKNALFLHSAKSKIQKVIDRLY